ncbi:MAG TPA: 3-methyl-2-oxobutanoate hydroxymethyltransferase [Fervidobacterium sp.]|jgi:3-methyl-2-oxobutanoate hydroxymethyltransferase|nr:3-methyl-2-oxobutanoate hydroxymethyltransferase [Fervidobacterium sp.]NLH37968.1 3-methyl-2-oxobutanoate hydroxymethyltransferase [Thermotogaceae bacterium]HOA17045.1 3-methyl-2-oxobutanoate hydroxymethyltransferase [Fervidobacterium sp.]HOH53787.1 3-methyl-2-oxobutanoate hydroxymethyltransferase [Fervidobacterium sp.]HOV53644.1 3-methyl-2-oxobutanoate hydroxymethyltransferase [Fervidobacterium sp.]
MNIRKIMEMKGKEPIVMITAYDYPSAKIAAGSEIDILLVGDSLGNVVLGYDSTVPVTMEDMLIHIKAVRRGAPEAFIVGDMPFLSYEISPEKAIENAGLMLKAGANAVKLEGGEEFADTIRKITSSGIPVMGHLGFTPQSVNLLGGHRVQGKTPESRAKLLKDAKALEDAGCFSIVLELVTEEVAKEVTESVTIPTIGIGAGRYCDGQVLVFHDVVGLSQGEFKFVKRYADTYNIMLNAVSQYKEDVKSKIFPDEKNVF